MRLSTEADKAATTGKEHGLQLDKLAGELTQVNQNLEDLRKSSVEAATVLKLTNRLETVEGQVQNLTTRPATPEAVLITVGQLREAIDRGSPFVTELNAVKVAAGEQSGILKAIEPVAARAAGGIPVRSALALRFARLAPQIIRSGALPDSNSVIDQTVQRLAQLVSIKRIDPKADGNATPAVVGRAKARMAKGDLAGAVKELSALQGAAAEQAAGWLTDARARLAAEQGLSQASAQAAAAIARRG